nr:unnamed protein product [Callosobruchus analis]
MRQVTGGPTNVRVKIALADQEYSTFLRKVQSRLWGSSTVARGQDSTRLGYSPSLSRHTSTRYVPYTC